MPARLLHQRGRDAGDFECLFNVMSNDGYAKLKARIAANPESYGLPDPPEATEHAMKGRDVQQMIGVSKR